MDSLDPLSFPQFFTGPSVQAKDAVKVDRAREHSAGIINHWVQSSGRRVAIVRLQSSTRITKGPSAPAGGCFQSDNYARIWSINQVRSG